MIEALLKNRVVIRHLEDHKCCPAHLRFTANTWRQLSELYAVLTPFKDFIKKVTLSLHNQATNNPFLRTKVAENRLTNAMSHVLLTCINVLQIKFYLHTPLLSFAG